VYFFTAVRNTLATQVSPTRTITNAAASRNGKGPGTRPTKIVNPSTEKIPVTQARQNTHAGKILSGRCSNSWSAA
jgi:hypothetical protein